MKAVKLLMMNKKISGIENFNEYTEVDPRGEITVTSNTISWSNARSVDYRVYKDFGTDFFDGNFEHKMELWFNAGSDTWEPNYQWALSNNAGSFSNFSTDDMYAGLRAYGGLSTNGYKFQFGVKGRSDKFLTVSKNTVYYVTIKRDESIGTYGRLTVSLYSDSARTNLVVSDYIDLSTKKNFRYYYPLLSENAGTSYYQSGYTKNVELG